MLLDAPLDAKSLTQIRESLAADPAVAEIKWLTGRNAGRFRFVEAGVALRLADLAKAEAALRRIEHDIQSAMPQIERVLLHVEARTSDHSCYAVPLADVSGAVSEHFGEAPYFGLVTVSNTSGAVEEQSVVAIPFHAEERAKGIRVAEWLVARKVDRVFVPKGLKGKGPAYVFREAGVALEETDLRSLRDILAAEGWRETAE